MEKRKFNEGDIAVYMVTAFALFVLIGFPLIFG
jgi:hypothetical protein